MNTATLLLNANCDVRTEHAAVSSHLALSLRARGVRYARMRCQTVWCETLSSRQARLFTPSSIPASQTSIS